MPLDQLMLTLLPPEHPLASGSPDAWDAIEMQLAGRLPGDYKQFIAKYGVGCIDNFITVYSPFTTNTFLNLFAQSKAVFNSLQIVREEGGVQLPFPLYPDEGGVFPWGCTTNGDHLFWRFRRGRFQHPVVALEGRGPDWQEFDLPLVDFLLNVLTKRVSVKVFPDGFPSDHPTFVAGE